MEQKNPNQKKSPAASQDDKNKTQKRKPKKSVRIAGIVLAVILAVSLLAVLLWQFVIPQWLARHVLSRVQTEEEYHYATTIPTEEPTETIDPDLIIGEPGKPNTEGLPLICNTKDVTNILLIGTDARTKNEACRSDTMMLVSINKQTKKIVMASFLRDILVHIEGDVKQPNGSTQNYDLFHKLNSAHMWGGSELLRATLKNNFNIDVQYFATVNFFSFVDIVDKMGGLDIECSAAEAENINFYLWEINDLYSRPFGTDYLPIRAGTYHLNGKQVLAYTRNRYVGNGDFARTERQRKVLSLMMDKAKTMSVSELSELLDFFLPMVTTNLNYKTLTDMIKNAPMYLGYELVQTHIPQNGMWERAFYNEMDIVKIDGDNAKANMKYLYEVIYGTPAPTATGNSKN